MKSFTRFLDVLFFLVPALCFGQQSSRSGIFSFEDSTLAMTNPFTILPFNRLVHSAGRVVTYGDSSIENHALDLCILPGDTHVAIEDRYGIAVMNMQTLQIEDRWSFNEAKAFKAYMSSYSGITSFTYKQKTYISWGAGGRDNGKSAVMIARWDGKKLTDVTSISLEKLAPADLALPNQILAHLEDSILYLYVALNGNDRLVKIRFDDQQTVWTAPTGVAPYGLCIAGKKIYVTNWAGPQVNDTVPEHAGTPWGAAYTDPATGATRNGSLSVLDLETGRLLGEIPLGLHPNAIIKSPDQKRLYISNGNSDNISVVDIGLMQVTETIPTGLFSGQHRYYGSSPNALALDARAGKLYVANGLDNALAVISLGQTPSSGHQHARIQGFIPTEAYPSGIVVSGHRLFVTNLEARGSRVLSADREIKSSGAAEAVKAYTIHKELASVSVIGIPNVQQLKGYTAQVQRLNLFQRLALSNAAPRREAQARPLPERIGEPSRFRHVVYIIKENKTYDQVLGDLPQGRGDSRLCVYGEQVTPNQHKLAREFSLLDNYYASGKSSAEGHQWADAGMASDYVEKNVRAWFRSYPHRQEDALVYNRSGFIWNNALDHGKKVRVYGEACLTHYEQGWKWSDIFSRYSHQENLGLSNTSTIARLRPIISPDYPDCDNINFTDQIRADVFIRDWKHAEQLPEDSLPELMVLSLPDDHTAGTSEQFPVPMAMVADNDLALGRIVETITASRFWDSTVIFVTEDDSQSGWDHISPYRTTCQVLSVYSNPGMVIHTNYNQTSMVRTIEQILGIPPMNILDATALPMFDCFTQTKRDFHFQHLPNNIELDKMNRPMGMLKGKAKYFARVSKNSAFKDLDGGNDELMNRILWFDAKGNQPYPGSK